MKVFKGFIHILANICYLLIFVYTLICVPMLLKYKPLVVLSGSMDPTYKVGTIIYFKEVPEEEIHVDDVITFSYENESYITHRVVGITNGQYETKGDANNSNDARMIDYDNIHGKVTKVGIPYLGYYVSYINTHLYLIGFVIVILVIEFIVGNIDTINIDGKKKDE